MRNLYSIERETSSDKAKAEEIVAKMTETVGGVECNVLKFQNPDVDWEDWILVSADPHTKKFHAKYKSEKGQPESTIEFGEWNLAPQFTDTTFLESITDKYDCIPIIQRASVVLRRMKRQRRKWLLLTIGPATLAEDSRKLRIAYITTWILTLLCDGSPWSALLVDLVLFA